MTKGRKLLVGVLMVAAAVMVVMVLFTVVFPWFDRTFLADPVMGLQGPPPFASGLSRGS